MSEAIADILGIDPMTLSPEDLNTLAEKVRQAKEAKALEMKETVTTDKDGRVHIGAGYFGGPRGPRVILTKEAWATVKKLGDQIDAAF